MLESCTLFSRATTVGYASNDPKMMPGFAAFILALNFGRFCRLLSERYATPPGITQFMLLKCSFLPFPGFTVAYICFGSYTCCEHGRGPKLFSLYLCLNMYTY